MVSIKETIKTTSRDIAEAERILSEQSAQLGEIEGQVSKGERALLKATKPKAFTLQRQIPLQQVVGIGGVGQEFKRIRKEKKSVRARELPKFEIAKGEIALARSQIAAKRAEVGKVKGELQELIEFQRGIEAADDSASIFGLKTKKEREGFRAGVAQQKASTASIEFAKTIKAFEKEQLKPIIGFEDGTAKITGFEDIKKGVSFSVENFGAVSLGFEPGRIERLQKAGVITVEKPESMTITDILPKKIDIQTATPDKKVMGIPGLFLTTLPLQVKSKKRTTITDISATTKQSTTIDVPKITAADIFGTGKGVIPGVTEVDGFSQRADIKIPEVSDITVAEPRKFSLTSLFDFSALRGRVPVPFFQQPSLIEAGLSAVRVKGRGGGEFKAPTAGADISLLPTSSQLLPFAVEGAKFVERESELARFIVFQPIIGAGQLVRQIGTGIKGEEFKGSGIVGTAVGGVGEIFPKTQTGVVLTAAGLKGLSVAPKVVQLGAGAFITGVEGKEVFNPELTAEQRVGSGIIGGLAGVGTAFSLTPFVRGVKARVSPEFKPIKKAEVGFEFIDIPETPIGLIKPGKGATEFIDLPKTSPLVRGGFQVKPTEKIQFIGKDQFLTTSQRDLFKAGRDIPLEKEFFVTPQEPTLKIAETRVSRLALDEFLKAPKEVEFGFGLPPKPQIGIFKQGDVGFVETKTRFKIGTGTELEAIKTTGTITEVTKIGTTRIKGQGIDIFEFKIGKVGKAPTVTTKPSPITTEGVSRVSTELITGTILGTTELTSRRVQTFKTPSFKTEPTKRTVKTSDVITTSFVPTISPPITTPTRSISPGITPITTPVISLTSPFLTGTTPPTTKKKDKGIKRKPAKTKKKVKKKATARVAPSFTARVLNIKGKFPTVSKRLGIVPSDIRVIPS